MQIALHAAALWSGILILLLITLSGLTVRRRQRLRVAFGHGDHSELEAAARAFGNAAEYIPAGMVALILLALTGAPSTLIHVLGATLLIARLVHAYGLLFQPSPSIGRVAGMVMTYLVLVVAATSLIAYGVL